MLGNNPTRAQSLDPAGAMRVQEVFPTLQGEGPYAGQSAVFVRLAGCNLRCWFCDTDFESNYSAAPLPASALWARVQEEFAKEAPESALVVLTGGEPFLQNFLPFVALCENAGIEVQVETAGTCWIAEAQRFIYNGTLRLVCSPKTPYVHREIERWCHDYKYIVSARMPIDFRRGVPMYYTQPSQFKRSAAPPDPKSAAPLFWPADPAATIWLQPCDEQDPALNAANRDLCVRLAMRSGHRVSVQLHKVLGLR